MKVSSPPPPLLREEREKSDPGGSQRRRCTRATSGGYTAVPPPEEQEFVAVVFCLQHCSAFLLELLCSSPPPVHLHARQFQGTLKAVNALRLIPSPSSRRRTRLTSRRRERPGTDSPARGSL